MEVNGLRHTDLASGYWQAEVRPEDREKTSFTTDKDPWQLSPVQARVDLKLRRSGPLTEIDASPEDLVKKAANSAAQAEKLDGENSFHESCNVTEILSSAEIKGAARKVRY
ncbi:hypothetical protein AVEN_73823-1 [Araneus ventricosus]|uniref:Uncharacterized protein n=1 Tax=Araneus ventricosus TaxID=182803 RepID=A0A4Y2SFW7_ARAVE|nr:hypothetical protein AVEN_73823-1 [Araneus ventricosus]